VGRSLRSTELLSEGLVGHFASYNKPHDCSKILIYSSVMTHKWNGGSSRCKGKKKLMDTTRNLDWMEAMLACDDA
jgi:hypothetical protein